MVKFINYYTGTTMYVAEDRVEEYKKAGHKPAAERKPVEPKPARKQTEKKKR